MKKKCLVSILMCIYKEPLNWLEKSIESVLNQTYQNKQIIIILDNPNYVEAQQLLEEYKKRYNYLSYHINNINLGLVKSLNKGLKLCNGDYIARMDADDISKLDRIENQISYLENYNYDIIGTKVYSFSENFKIERETLYSNKACKLALFCCPCMAHPTWLAKRKVYEKNKGYRDIDACEDYDFIIRAVKNNFRIGNIPKVLLYYRDNCNSISHIKDSRQFVISKFLAKKWQLGYIPSEKDIEKYIKSVSYKKKISFYRNLKKIEEELTVSNDILYKIKLYNKMITNPVWVKNKISRIYIRCIKILDKKIFFRRGDV